MINRIGAYICLLLLCASMGWAADSDSDYWWPTQAVPKALVCVDYHGGSMLNSATQAGPIEPLGMLAESLAGLAAKAVNEKRSDELVWLDMNKHADYEDWLKRATKRLKLKMRGTFSTWELLDRCVKRDIVKGYVLYRYDTSIGDLYAHRANMDRSVNVATSMAGLLDGVLIDESIEAEAKKHGLRLLFDARKVSQNECFQKYRNRFSRSLLCTQDPRIHNTRDLAIAHKAFTFYGYDAPATAAMEYLNPLSPILGWNGGDEGETTMMSSIYGQIQTATNWCMNMPVLMAGAEKVKPVRFESVSAKGLDWKDNRSAVSYIMSDGDNVQWFQGGFARGQEPSWWTSPERGKIPFGWSACFTELIQLSPDVLDYFKETQTPNDWFVEWGGGYYYPECFGRARSNPQELLARHVRCTWNLMKKSNIRSIGFNFHNLESKEAKEAYQIIAKEMDGVLGVFAFQYAPYEAGAGKVFWVNDGRNRPVPIVTARYTLWVNANDPKSLIGTPAKVARHIIESVKQTPAGSPQRLDWVISHCWSYFKDVPGADEDAENLPQSDAPAHGGIRGYVPTLWSAERLPESIRVVSPYELLWRIRMQHDPKQTMITIKSEK